MSSLPILLASVHAHYSPFLEGLWSCLSFWKHFRILCGLRMRFFALFLTLFMHFFWKLRQLFAQNSRKNAKKCENAHKKCRNFLQIRKAFQFLFQSYRKYTSAWPLETFSGGFTFNFCSYWCQRACFTSAHCHTLRRQRSSSFFRATSSKAVIETQLIYIQPMPKTLPEQSK